MPPSLSSCKIREHRLVQNDCAQLGQEFVTGGDAPRLRGNLRIGKFKAFAVAFLENQPASHGLGQASQMFGMDGYSTFIVFLEVPMTPMFSLLTVVPF